MLKYRGETDRRSGRVWQVIQNGPVVTVFLHCKRLNCIISCITAYVTNSPPASSSVISLLWPE